MNKWERIAARKRAKKVEQAQGLGRVGLVWRPCEICKRNYCPNNNRDRKIRIRKWHGIEVCAGCQYNVIPQLKNLMALGIIKWTKEHKPK